MIRDFSQGLFRENPVFSVGLALCPALAVTTRVDNAIGLGTGVLLVLLVSLFVVSLLRDFIPARVALPSYFVIIATFVALLDMLMQVYTPDLSKNLGIFVPLITVNCLILGRIRTVAEKSKTASSVIDALGMGVGFTLALVFIATVREILGSGTITLFPFGSFSGVVRIPGLAEHPIRFFGLSAGAFLTVGYLKALFDIIRGRKALVKEEESP